MLRSLWKPVRNAGGAGRLILWADGGRPCVPCGCAVYLLSTEARREHVSSQLSYRPENGEGEGLGEKGEGR